MTKLLLNSIVFMLCSYSVHSIDNFVKNSNEVSLKLLNVFPQNENNFYSPLSITYSLNAILNGADGQTAAELKNLLNSGSNATIQSTNSEIKTLMSLMRDKNTDEMAVRFANRILVSNAVNLTQSFQNTIKDDFESEVDSVDFATNAPNITEEINAWISEQTNGKIPKLFNTLDMNSVMVLANALYFKGRWEKPFGERSTYNHTFNGLKNQTTVPMMRVMSRFRYTQNSALNTTLIELPFAGTSNLSMIILLPNETITLNQLTQRLDSESLTGAVNQLLSLQKSHLLLLLPKFNLKTDYDLKDSLTALGVNSLFTSDADLSHITGANNLKVSKAVHKANINVEEAGVEAAAATGIVTVNKIGVIAPPLTVDRPFLFLIQDTQTGLILFMGQVCDLNLDL